MAKTLAEIKTELGDLLVVELRAQARDAGIAGYSKLRKAELVDLLASERSLAASFAPSAAEKAVPSPLSACEHGTAPQNHCAGCEQSSPAYAAQVAKVREIRARVLAARTAEKCLLEHGYVKPCQQDRGHSGACDKETVGLVRTTGTQRAQAVEIHTTGELHPAPKIEGRITFTFNLSDLLDDPAHKPGAELIKLDGLDARVQDFVFATDGALDLYDDMVRLIETPISLGKHVTVLVLCRGGKHRSVAFGDNLAAHFSVEATHHHRHLGRVIL